MLCGINTSGTYIPPKTPHTELHIVNVPFADKVLMNQPYILDDSKTVEQFIKEAIAKTGENITVRQFKRIELGVTE